jgi:uncharacterized membrane protein
MKKFTASIQLIFSVYAIGALLSWDLNPFHWWRIGQVVAAIILIFLMIVIHCWDKQK